MATILYYTFEFIHAAKTMQADCQELQVAKYPQIRVAIENGRKMPQIFIFYRNAPKNLYWFKLPNGNRESLAKH